MDIRDAGAVWLLVSCLLSVSASAQVSNRAYQTLLNTLYKKSVPLMTVAEVRQQPDLILLDTREKKEFDVSHLPNARWVGYDDFDLKRVADLPKTAHILTYCSVGVRSEKVGEKLLAAGYTNVHNLDGSLFEWVNLGYPIVDNAGKSTTRVHAYSRVWGIWLRRGDKVYD
ncbi:MAG: rhodanese-like domain-containing protein [Bacteroidetes bacterium]|nr:rhodanese-like domain-containing protein [Fibrella sp.]